ncbi:hypothetical protein C1X27_08370 [Pseudomonas sp. MPR-AND1B]|nr:hypothetical protein C1X26_11615 [Pseudomonas sp. MPR-R3A]PNB03371.1 hypothetical protein C1X27_08370 [Pseudomonas sp. MPR-AND1B]PRW70035.1 hypothetical protein C7A09_06300 [Pseudomonas fluorescens]RZI28161.1 hypothetical protein EUX58_01600 [Pseudomonas sp. 770NI]
MGFCVDLAGLFASKPAPTFGMRSNVGAGLLAKGPAQALHNRQKSTFATSANRLAKCTVIPSFK